MSVWKTRSMLTRAEAAEATDLVMRSLTVSSRRPRPRTQPGSAATATTCSVWFGRSDLATAPATSTATRLRLVIII